ncbi:MAG: DUF433 domain-containing protein [Acidimicrobiia bacterium]|nr:DUF433 domain-containing protein [Acidimicrobiia bacterium]
MSDPSPPARAEAREIAPRGHYLAFEVGRLAGVSGQTIGQWKRNGYIRASQKSRSYPNVYSYQDVAEAMVVHHLLDQGADLLNIGRAIDALRDAYGLNWPLSPSDLVVYGDDVAVREGRTLFDVSQKQYPWHTLIAFRAAPQVAVDLRRGGWAAHQHPKLRYIEVNPNRLSGRPAIRGTRVPAEDVALLAAEPKGRALLKRDYGISGRAVDDAIVWWRAVQTYEPLAA